MFSRRIAASFAIPCGLLVRQPALNAPDDAARAKSTPDNVVHQPSFRPMNTRAAPRRQVQLPPVTLDSLTLISGTAHRSLAEEISREIAVPLCNASVSRFSDGEVSVQINDNIRGRNVFVIQTCTSPVNDSIMELLLTISCARRSNVRRIVAVIPYFGYKHHRRGNSLSTRHNSRFLWSSAGDFAVMLQEMGVDGVIALDLQRPGQGIEASFFDTTVPVESVISTDLFIQHLTQELQLNLPVTVVAPNAELFHKARKFQSQLEKRTGREVKLLTFYSKDTGVGPTDTTQLATLDSREPTGVTGDVVIVDDMVDTGGTIQALSTKLKQAGAQNIYICASHGLFTENAFRYIDDSPITKVFVTNSLPLPKNASAKVQQISVAKFLADVILTEHFRTTMLDDEFEDD